MEVIGPVAGFAEAAVRSGFAWLAEDYLPQADEENEGDDDGPEAGPMSRLYLTMPSMAGLKKLLAYWRAFSSGQEPNDDTAKRWWALFGYLADVRVWSAQDRVDPSLASYVEATLAKADSASVRVEFDLWFRGIEGAEEDAFAEFAAVLGAEGGEILDAQSIPEIRYHGVLASLPAASARRAARKEGPLADAATVMTIRPQSLFRIDGLDDLAPEEGEFEEPPAEEELGSAVAALLDGYPVQAHSLLANRVDIEEVDVAGADAPVISRFHGTAMASLILHGDLSAGEPPLDRMLKVVPILAAAQGAHVESTPVDKLPIAMVYRAVEALVGANGVAPGVVVFNHSVCDVSGPFVRRPSAWARLLDYLSYRYRVLFIVSAGNIHAPVPLPDYADHADFASADPVERGVAVLRGVEAVKGTRGILTPAEAVNAVTVGALHADGGGDCPPHHIEPYGFAAANLCSGVGLGVNRSVKPDLVEAGGRQVALAHPHADGFAIKGHQIGHIGQGTAAPDVHGGSLDHVIRSTGTSNAAALTTRSAVLLADALEDVAAASGERWLELPTRAVMLKALLVHGCRWGDVGAVLDRAYPPAGTMQWRRRRETITRFLGFGQSGRERVIEGDRSRITLLGDDVITSDTLHEYRIPVPHALLNSREVRRIVLTLAWCTPVQPATTAYRGVALDIVDSTGKRKFWKAVSPLPQPHPDDDRRGTVIHRVYEGASKIKAIGPDGLFVGVQARALHDSFRDAKVPYALAVTLEVAQTVRADIYADVRSRVRSRVRTRERVRSTGDGA